MDWKQKKMDRNKGLLCSIMLVISFAVFGCENMVGPETVVDQIEKVKIIVVGKDFPVLGSLSRVNLSPRTNLSIGWSFDLEGIKSYAVTVGRFDGAGSYQPVWFVYNIPFSKDSLAYSKNIPVGSISSNSPPDLLDGEYRIFIDAYDGELNPDDLNNMKPLGRGGVTLMVGRGGFPNPDENGTFATASRLDLNKSIVSEIEQIYEIDVYSLDLAPSQRVTIDLGNLTGELALILYDFNGRELASAGKDGVLSRSMSFSASNPATYYLKVLGEVTAIGNYELTAEDENATFESADEIKLSTPIDGQINPPGDLDYYSINLNASENMTFFLTKLNSDLDLVLYDGKMTKVKESNDNNLISKEEKISFLSTQSGTIYLGVKGYRNARGRYTLEAKRQ